MTGKEKEIINYISRITKGVVKITEKHAAEIINISCSNIGARADIYRYNQLNGSYGFMRSIWFRNNIENEIINLAISKKPVEKYYKYEIFDADENFVTNIFSVTPNLLD